MFRRMRISFLRRKVTRLLTKEKFEIEHLHRSNEALSEILSHTDSFNEKTRAIVIFYLDKHIKELSKFKDTVKRERSALLALSKRSYLSTVSKKIFLEQGVKQRDIQDLDRTSAERSKLENDTLNDITALLDSLQKCKSHISSTSSEELIEFMKNEKKNTETILLDLQKLVGLVRISFSHAKLTRRKFLKTLTLGSMAVANNLHYSYAAVHAALKIYVQKLPKPTTNALAIVIGDVSPIGSLPVAREVFFDMYCCRLQLAVGMRAKVIKFYGTKQDFFQVLKDPSIQHVALFTHGNREAVWMKDGMLIEPDIYKIAADLHREGKKARKEGHFFKHSCGSGSMRGLNYFGESFFRRKQIVFYKRFVGLPDVFLNPWGRKDHFAAKIGELQDAAARRVIDFSAKVRRSLR